MLRLFLVLVLTIVQAACSAPPAGEEKKPAAGTPTSGPPVRVLHVDSYHRGFAWSDGIAHGIESGFRQAALRVDVRRFTMDSKRHPAEEERKLAARRAWDLVQAWRPNLVIASDDNAVKYLVVPYLLGGELPVVFCGVNWDASRYGLPAANVTGMVEVSLEDEVVRYLRPHARGDRIGFIGPDVLTTRLEAENVRRYLGLDLQTYYAKNADDFMHGFQLMQEQVDILLINSDGGLYQDRLAELIPFVQTHTRIPTGAMFNYMKDYALLTIGKVPEEQGEWAAATGAAILQGTPVSAIPLARNHRSQVYINMATARRLGIVFPMELVDQAQFLGQVSAP